MRIDFYHLSVRPLETVLPAICEKVLGDGGRLLVVTEQAEAVDRLLWSYAPESFLPHAPAGGSRDADQPVLITAEVTAGNDARNVALADGLWRDEALSFDRIFYFFDAATIGDARAAWRALKDHSGAERHYWKQDERGRWVEGP
jgi:DNA polymerase III subunit chi